MGPSGWISDVCKQRGLRTVVCSTNDEAWAWKNTKRKTDRDDALKLAKMALLDALTPVHIPSPQVRQPRMLKLMPEVPPEEAIIRVKRPEVRPAGELHSEQPKHPASRGRSKRKRRGAPRRSPLKS